MIKLLISLTILAWPLGHLLGLPSFGAAAHWNVLDALNFLILSCVLIKDHTKILKDPLSKYILLFALTAFLSLIANFQLGVTTLLLSSLYMFRFLSSVGIYFALKEHFKKDYLKLFIISLTLFVVLGFAQYILLPDTRFLKYFGFDDHYYRLIGTLLDPNFTGIILASITLFLISKNKWVYSLATLVALALTFSRASYLSFFVGLVVLAILKKKLKLILLTFSLLLFIFLIPKPFGEGVNLFRTYSIYSRMETQSQAVSLFLEKPILGHGFNTLKFTNISSSSYPLRASGIDNSFLFVLATTGIIGFITFLLLLFQIGKTLLPYPELIAIYISLLFHSLFNNTFFFLWVTQLLWTTIAICLKTPTKAKK